MASQFIVVNGQKRNRTMITFSNGAQWHRIPAPTYVDGEPARCYLVRQIMLHMQYYFIVKLLYKFLPIKFKCSIYSSMHVQRNICILLRVKYKILVYSYKTHI